MTQPPTSPYVAPPRARRRRPSAWWFVVGGALVLAAIVSFVGLFAWTLTGFLDTDATVDANDRPETVRLEGDDRRMLWLEDGLTQTCVVTDPDTGDEVATRSVSGDFTRSEGDTGWTGSVTFAPGSGSVEIACTGGGTVVVGPAPALGSFVVGLLATILVPLLLGGGGVVVLIVTGVLFSTGRPRDVPAHGDPSETF
ncbi:MAG: hypothetical protein WC642_05745 [Nocardioides sp.]